jgi:D-ribose pyranase
VVGHIFMAAEFKAENTSKTQQAFSNSRGEIPISFKPHVEFKRRVPQAVGLIHTGDMTQYANMILESA